MSDLINLYLLNILFLSYIINQVIAPCSNKELNIFQYSLLFDKFWNIIVPSYIIQYEKYILFICFQNVIESSKNILCFCKNLPFKFL